jgi:hypothetical protein
MNGECIKMKIWKGVLILFHNENEEYETKFKFELQDKEYNLNKSGDEWTHFGDWVSDSIPVNMTIERYYDDYKIIQGFDHELSKKELMSLEYDMRELMRKQSFYDKEIYLKKWEEKFKII